MTSRTERFERKPREKAEKAEEDAVRFEPEEEAVRTVFPIMFRDVGLIVGVGTPK
jgi:hypothetical protein